MENSENISLEQVKAWYEGAEMILNPKYNASEPGIAHKYNPSEVHRTGGDFWMNYKKDYIELWDAGGRGFAAEITRYRELKVGDTVELNGIEGKVIESEGRYFIYGLNDYFNYELLGADSVEGGNRIANRIVGCNYQTCPTLQDLSKLYWVRKYELKYGEPREDSANKEEHKTANNMSEKKELIGYNWKEEKYAKMWWASGMVPKGEFEGFEDYFRKFERSGKNISLSGDSPAAKKLRKEGLLDLWTVPVCKDLEKVFTMGFGEDTFKVVVKDNKAYHNDDDITAFVEGLNEAFNIPTTVGGYSYVLEDKNVVFTSTGCQNKKTSLEQWDEVHDALG